MEINGTRSRNGQSLILRGWPMPKSGGFLLNRPDKRNAQNLTMVEAFLAALELIRADRNSRWSSRGGPGKVSAPAWTCTISTFSTTSR